MSQKSWYVLRIVAGLYLVYLGISIIRGLLSERPEDMLLKSVIAVVFIVVGALYAGFSAKRVWKMNQEEQMGDPEEDADDEEAEASEAARGTDENSNLEIADDIESSGENHEDENSLIDVENDFEDESKESGIEAADEEEK